MNNSIMFAFDFDGVICDSVVETAISGWKAAREIWHDMPETMPWNMTELFRQVRPVIETGYEAILTMRMLQLGESVETIYHNYKEEFQLLMVQARTDSEDLKKLFGATRDAWITADKADWIQKNPIYPGMAEKLSRLTQSGAWCVVTTKQERFVKKILQANGIELDEELIFGLDRRLSKPEVLKLLLKKYEGQTIYFIEDRLPALLKVRKERELAVVRLVFALWGYNSTEDKRQAKLHGFDVQRLDEFLS